MKELVGKVVSIKMLKTVVVEVTSYKLHPLYKKHMRVVKRFKAHNEDGGIKEGDWVKIVSTPPISKEKHFKVKGRVEV